MIALLKTKIGMAVAGGFLALLLGSGGWVWILYDRIEGLNDDIGDLQREAGNLESAIAILESDNASLAASLDRQTQAVYAMRDAMLGERARADAAAEETVNEPTPVADDGAVAMLEWWNDHVVQ